MCEFKTRSQGSGTASGVLLVVTLLLTAGSLHTFAADVVLRDRDSFDNDHQLASGLLQDDQVAIQGMAFDAPSSALPEASDLDAYALADDGTVYFSTDVTVDLGGVILGPGDVARIEPGGSATIELSAADIGLALGAGVDALTLTGDSAMPLALSFDTTVELASSGGTIVLDDEDLAKTDGALFDVYFDGSAAGLDTAVDLDGAYVDAVGGELRLSLDVAGEVAGLSFDDEDVLAYDLVMGNWRMVRDRSAALPELATGNDLDAYSVETIDALFADDFASGDLAEWAVANP